MEITAEDRQIMHQIINFQIKNIPNKAQFGKDQKIKISMGVSSSFDFVMGMLYANIIDSISTYLREKMKFVEAPTPDEFREIMKVSSDVTIERLPEIKEAVNKALV